jgi:cell shape-determining protein MreC
MLIYSRYTWWIAAMFAVAMFLGVAGQVGVLNPFQGLFLRATGPVESLTLGIFEPAATFLSGAGDLDELQDQNDRLRIENEELRNRIAELEQDTQRLEEPEAALG